MSSSTSTLPSSLGLDAVNVSLHRGGGPQDVDQSPQQLPLVVTPRFHDSLEFLRAWCQANRVWLDAMMLKHGAVLVRGFQIDGARDMERAIQSYQPCLNNTYRGTSPRRLIEGAQKVFSAAEVPSNYPIAQHLEMSFLDAPPAQLYFGCLKPSASAGGETSLCDFAKVAKDLSPALKNKFVEKGIRYTRTHKKRGTYFTYDVADMLGWPEMFGTNDKKQVEKMAADEGIPVTWLKGDTFQSVTRQDAFQLHPVTGELVWFNHTQVFHWTTFPAELWFAFTRTRDLRLLLHWMLVTIFCVIKYGLLGHKMGLHSTFGDGTEISVQEMAEVRKAIHDNMVYSRWQKGDMIWIDNMRVSHGRQPTYDKSRKVVVAWADPLRKANAVKSLEKSETTATIVEEEEPMLLQENITVKGQSEQQPILTENLQEHSPTSTLNFPEAHDMHDAIRKLSENPAQDHQVNEQTLHVLKNIIVKAEQAAAHRKNQHSKHLSATTPDFWQPED